MKKYFIIASIFLLAAACSKQQPPAETAPVSQNQPATSTPEQATTTPLSLPIKYNNTQYGFIFSLPEDWQGYKIIIQSSGGWSWEASKSPEDSTIVSHGPAIIIRNPLWTADKPYQDIPIQIFTIQQWQDVQSEKIWYRTAAPIGPGELGRNNQYVFALPARYNFADSEGIEEVANIISQNPLKGY